MKKLMKRWLAMMLAVLMVMGTLPTTAWAARMDRDEVTETPVLDKDDPVADTMRKDDEEIPTDPEDPGNTDPADPLQLSWKVIDLEVDGSTGLYTVTIEGDPGTRSASWSLAIVPMYIGEGGTLATKISSITGSSTKTNMETGLEDTALNSNAYHVTGSGFDGNGTLEMATTLPEGQTKATVTVTGTMPTVSAMEEALKGTKTEAGEAFSAGEAIELVVMLATQDGSPYLHKEFTKSYGGGMSDSTWVVNINGGTVKRLEGTALTDVDGASYNAGTQAVRIPLINTSATELTVPFFAGTTALNGVSEFVSFTGNATIPSTTTDTTATSTTPGTLPFTLANTNPQNIVFQVPYYNSDSAKMGTITVTVMVVNTQYLIVPDPIEFRVEEGYSETTKAITFPDSFTTVATSATNTYRALYFTNNKSGGIGGAVPTVDNLTVDFGNAQIRTGGGSSVADTSYRGLLKGVGAGEQDTEKHTVRMGTYGTPNPTVTLNMGLSAGTYTRTIPMGALSANTTGTTARALGEVVIPVTIIVSPREAETKYNYELQYDLNGGSDPSGTFTTQVATNLDTSTHTFNIHTGTPTRTGYHFAGWTCAGGTYDSGAGTVTITGVANDTATATLTAQWEQDTFSVQYHYSGTTPSGATAPTTQNNIAAAATGTHTLTQPAAVSGWTFNGWTLGDASGAGAGGVITTVSLNQADGTTVHVWGTWTQITHPVTYSFGAHTPKTTAGAAITLPTQTAVAEGGSFTVSSALTKDSVIYLDTTSNLGFTFTGWSDGTTTHNPSASITMGTNPITLTAQWAAVNRTVTYNRGNIPAANVTLPATNPATVQYGGSHTVAASPLNGGVTGWTFKHWSNGATTYNPSATISNITTNITLTAQWQVDVSFNLNGASGTAPTTQTIDYNTAATAPTAPTRLGWVFNGWYTEATGGSAWNFSTNVTAPTTLYAHWTQQGKIVFNPGAGAWASSVTAAAYQKSGAVGTTTTAPAANQMTYAGHTFSHWEDASHNSTSTFTFAAGTWGGADNDWDDAAVYTAVWTADPRTVTFMTNDGTGNTHDTKSTSYGTALGAGNYPTNPTRTGYTFAGWFPNADGSGTEFTNATVVTNNITVYAHWTANTYNVTYDLNSGNNPSGVTIAAGTFTYGSNYTIPVNYVPTRTNYVFTGWRATAGVTGTYQAGGTITTGANDIALQAQWQGQSSVAFNVNGGTWVAGGGAQSQTGNTGANITMPTAPTRTGYTFAGWNTDNTATTGATTGITFPTTVGQTDTYYAIWTPETRTVTFNRNWTSTDSTAVATWTRNYDGTVLGAESALPTATRTYYTFDGWYTARTGGTQITGAETVTANVTYYAHWTQKTSTVTVTLHVDGAEANPGRQITIGFNGATATVATTATTATFNNVLQQATAYPITVEGAAYGNVTVGDNTAGATVNYTVDFATAEVVTNGNGDASVEAQYGSMSSALTASTDYANSTMSNSIVVLSGQTATWKDGTAQTNYAFKSWDSASGTDTANKDVTMAATQVSHTAYFSRVSYDTQLLVTLNGANQNSSSVGSGNDIVSVTANAGTVSYESGHWVTKGVSSSTNVTWTVGTISGNYTVTGNGDDTATSYTPAELDLYSVETALNATGDNAQATMVTNSHAAQTRAVVRLNQRIDLTASPKTGYTLATPYWTEGTTNRGTVAAGRYTLTTAITATQTLTPVYTFEATIHTQYNSADTAPGGAVVLKSTEADKTLIGTNGSYPVSGLTPGVTYTVWVNGFKSDTTVSAPGAANVTLYRINVVKDPTASTGTAYINLGAAASGSATLVYVPAGGSSTDTDAPNINLAAAGSTATDTATGYRLENLSGETLWTGATTIVAVNSATTTMTVDDMDADITVTANFMAQHTAHVSVSGGSHANTDAKFTATGGTGTVIATGDKNATVDDNNGYVEATFTAGTGDTLANWTFANGDLWSTSGKESGSKLTSGQATTKKVVYFFPTDDNATLTANVVAATYPVTVTVNKDNGAYTGRTVELHRDSSTFPMTEGSGASAGTYTANVLPGTYTVYVDGVTTGTVANTNKTVTFTADDAEHKDGEGNADPRNTAATVNYYTVNLAASPTAGGTVNFTSGTTTSRIVLATNSTQNLAVQATPSDAASAHYRFNNWTAAVGTAPTAQNGNYVLPVENTLTGTAAITPTTPITVTANFVKQFQVTVKKANAGWTFAVGTAVTAPSGSTAWPTTALVDEGSSVLVYTSPNLPSDYPKFKEWHIEEGNGAGTFTNVAPNASVTDLGLEQPGTNNVFTPTADSTLVLELWEDATLSGGGWTYDRGTGYNNSNGTTGGTVKTLTWTVNDAQDPPTSVEVAPGTGASMGTPVTLTLGTHYTVSGSTYTFTDTYLKGLTKGSYTAIFTYTLGEDDHVNNYPNQTKTAMFHISPSAHKLTSVNIEAEDGGNTVNPAVGTRDAVEYLDHTVTDIPHSALTFTWYYADTAPTQQNFNNESNPENAAKAAAAAVSATEITSGVTPWTDGTNSIATGTAAVTNAMKGKYIFAVVVADDEISEGAVITNAIPVDYDATVTVNKDGAAVAADFDHYKVYLVPSGTTVAQTDFATAAARTAKGIVEATHVAGTDGNGVYSTKDSALTGATSYTVWVNDAESSTYYLRAAEAGTVTPTSNTGKVVNYFSVNRNPFTQSNFQDSSSNPVGETFTAGSPAIDGVTTANGSAVADGAGVHTGTSITATSATWTQDYTLTWQKSTNSDALANTATKQNSATAHATGFANGAVTAKTNLGGVLTQNTYTITGDVNGSGQIVDTGTGIPTLTANGHTFNATNVTNSGAGGAIVTFVVPKSGVTAGTITDNYTITATPKSGTTILGYAAPAAATLPTTSDQLLDQVTADGDDEFTVFIEATDLRIEVKDADDANHVVTPSGTGTATVNHSDREKFADYSALTRVVTITNKGNTPLNVTLSITKGAGTVVFDGSQSLGTGKTLTDSGNGVTIAGVERTFALDVGEDQSFTVTIPADLNNDDDVEYHFNFTTTDGRTGVTANGPTGIYNLNVVIDPVTVSKVTTTKVRDAGGTGKVIRYEVASTEVEEDGTDASKPHYNALVTMGDENYNTPDGNADIVYEWYVAPWDAKVTLDKTTGVPKFTNDPVNGTNAGNNLPLGSGTRTDHGTKYAPAASENGMALFLVAKGQRDATSAAMTPDVDAEVPEPVELVPYAASIQVIQNTTPITTAADANGYHVELRLKNPPATMPNNVPSTLAATWDDTAKVFKTEERLWASNPDHPDTANPWTYEVWANTVKGDGTLQNTGKTIKVDAPSAEVVYHQVNINATTVNQNTYQGDITPATDTTHFYHAAPHNPTAAVGTIDVDNGGWVQTGSTVTFTYAKWDKDYDLAWTGGVTGSDTAAQGNAGDRTHSATYSSQLAAVDTQLKLNLYPVTANVTGTAGWVNKLTMVLTEDKDYTFVTKTDNAGDILAIDQSGLDSATSYRIAVGKSVVFQLPKADGYVTTAAVPDQATSGVERWEYVYGGTTTPGRPTNESATVAVNVTGTNDTYAVNLVGAGLNLTVSETALPTDRTNATTMQTGMGSIPNAATADVTNGTVNQTIHLNYNNYDGQTVTVQVANTTTGLPIYNVTWTEVTTNNISMAGAFTGGTMAAGDSESVTLNIADDKAAGDTINYTATISFTNQDSSKTATVTYNLTVIVDPLPFTDVTTKTEANGDLTIDQYEVTRKAVVGETAGVALKATPNATESAADTTPDNTGLVKTNDYTYQWYAGPVGDAKPTVTWNSTDGSVTLSDSNVTAIAGATSRTLAKASIPEGKAVYLVIAAGNGKNASEAAISDAITTGYTGKVQIYLDHSATPVTTQPTPAYTVEFVPSNGGANVAGHWDDTEDGYIATLDPAVPSYTVKVSRYQGDTTTVDLAGAAITNGDRTARADYYTVTAKPFNPKHYLAAAGETFADADKQFTVALGGNTLTSGTPVLSGQSVTATANSRTQDYTLTWQSANVTTNVSAEATTADTTVHTNSYTQTITDTTFIGGRLDQNTYTVTGSIKNPTGKTGGAVSRVALAFTPEGTDARNFTLTANTTSNTGDHVFVDGSTDGTFGNAGDTVTFKVVKGAYHVTATEGANTTITSVTIGPDGVVTTETNTSTGWTDRNQEDLTPAVTGNGRVFNIYVEARDLALKVADGHTGHEATSTTLNNNQHTTHPAVYYFDSVDTTAIPLTLTNPGNAQLTVSGAVTKVTSLTGVDFAAGTGLGTLLVEGDKVTVAGLPNNGTLAVSGTLAGGSVRVAADAANTDDGIYIVKFTSTTTDTSGTPHDGPTVYYVFDLTVDPLPIVGVDAEKDAATGVMSLEDAAGANGGRNHVWVDHDGVSGTAAEAASAHNIVDGDLSFVWVKAPVSKSKADVVAALTLGTGITSSDGDVTVTGYTGKTCTPTTAEQGMNFYLVAYRSGDSANTSDFAVSDAVYANVVVGLKTHRTGTSTEVADTLVQITGVVNDDSDPAQTDTSNDGTLTVTANGQTILFNADKNDFLHNKTPGTADDPASATYYFTGWGASPAGGITPDADDRLSMEYAATENATVIGYYDLLPTLTNYAESGSSLGYNNNTGEDVPNNRTMKYTSNDGSGAGNVTIVIEPVGTATFNGALASYSKVELNGTSGAFESVNGVTDPLSMAMGVTGDYVLDRGWIVDNLKVNATYQITFYDRAKGQYSNPMSDPMTANDSGYAGYDRVVTLRITGGEVFVTAQAEDTDTTTGTQNWGEVQTTSADATNGDGGRGVTSTAKTSGGQVTIQAFPNAGYVFDKWTVVSEMGGTIGNATSATTTFLPDGEGTIVEASFVPGDFTVADKKALVIYGNDHFETGSDTSVAATAPVAAGTTFTYAVVNTTDMPGWLQLNTTTGEFSFATDAVLSTNKKVDTNVQSSTTGSYTKVDNEIELTVRVTSNAGATKDVTYTIDVEQGALTVNHAAAQNTATARGDAYKAANIAAGTTVGDVTTYPVAVDKNGVPMYNETVLKQLFTYTKVVDQAGTEIDATGHAGDAANSDSGVYANGTWTVNPTRFQGTGEASTYEFTFTYKPGVDAEKWNYTAGKTNMTLTIAKPPVGALFADAIANAGDVIPGAWTNDDTSDYSLVAVPEDYDGTSGVAPTEMDYTEKTFRKNETITYLDDEPTYTVKLKSVDAAIHGATFTANEMTGFRLAAGSAYPTFTDGQFASTDGEKTFVLELAPVSGSVWVGEHHAKFTLTGYSTAELAAAGGEPNVTATYELTVRVLPKVITSVDVSVLDPDTTPDEVTGTTEDGGTVDNETPDPKGNTPIADVDVTWGPEDGPDGKHTDVKVDVTIDPNYKYAEDKDDTPTEDEDITEHTDTTVKETLPDGTVSNRAIPEPTVERDGTDGDHIIHIDQAIPYLMHADANDGDSTDATGPKVDDRDRKVSVMQGAKDLGSYTIDLDAFGASLYDVVWTVEQDSITADAEGGIGAVLDTLPTGFTLAADGKRSVKLDLSAADTSKPGTYTLTLVARGKANADDAERTIQSLYEFQLTIRPAGGGGPVEPPCPCKVLYYVGSHGTTSDATIEDVSEKNRPSQVPSVTALDGYVFRGWSLANPATLKDGEKIELVDPKTVEAKGETMTFYAVIVERPFHEHYVIGYPNGNFGPADDITRGSVATIIARAVLPDFVEGANYGNPGNYSDVSGHWAESAIAYCSQFGVFEGYTDGTFRPDQPITRQEFAVVIARLDGELTAQDIPFDDIDQAGAWALNGIYTAYEKGWVTGYTDGTFQPLNNIRRDEAVKIFNAYLNRGVDADGLIDLHEYIHSGDAGNITGNGVDEYMTWPDVPRDHWAYYEIIEAANDHEYTPDFDAPLGYTLPEHWEKSWIDARWRYSGSAAD